MTFNTSCGQRKRAVCSSDGCESKVRLMDGVLLKRASQDPFAEGLAHGVHCGELARGRLDWPLAYRSSKKRRGCFDLDSQKGHNAKHK